MVLSTLLLLASAGLVAAQSLPLRCPRDARTCADGTVLTRQPPLCRFQACAAPFTEPEATPEHEPEPDYTPETDYTPGPDYSPEPEYTPVPTRPVSPCAYTDCAPGYVCEEVTHPCLVPPCPVQAVCRQVDAPCAFPCPALYQPVCGSDGVTYPNSCELRRAACSQGYPLSVEHQGQCRDGDDHHCGWEHEALVRLHFHKSSGMHLDCQHGHLSGDGREEWSDVWEVRMAPMGLVQLYSEECDAFLAVVDGVVGMSTEAHRSMWKPTPAPEHPFPFPFPFPLPWGGHDSAQRAAREYEEESSGRRRGHEQGTQQGMEWVLEWAGAHHHTMRLGVRSDGGVMTPSVVGTGRRARFLLQCVKDRRACPRDYRVCPDGSVVVRHLPSCDFSPCPLPAPPCMQWECGQHPPFQPQQWTCDDGSEGGLTGRCHRSCHSGECEWEMHLCSGMNHLVCYDSDGNVYQHGEQWQVPGFPCEYYECRNGNVESVLTSCPYEECDGDGHMWLSPSHDQCCGRCVACPSECPGDYHPLCGTDGHTYHNECFHRMHQCLMGQWLDLAHEGSCACDLQCDDDYFPVCGTDGETYPNECWLEAGNCAREWDEYVLVKHYGECGQDPCDFECDQTYQPVCGSNHWTYPNECVLAQTQCGHGGGDVTLEYSGECDVCEDVPCPPEEMHCENTHKECKDDHVCRAVPGCVPDSESLPCQDPMTGQEYKAGTVTTVGCMEFECSNGRLQWRWVACPLSDSNCPLGETPADPQPGECCSTCVAVESCKDPASGEEHLHGEQWTSSSNPCKHYFCMEGDVEWSIEECPECDAATQTLLPPEQGQCCGVCVDVDV